MELYLFRNSLLVVVALLATLCSGTSQQLLSPRTQVLYGSDVVNDTYRCSRSDDFDACHLICRGTNGACKKPGGSQGHGYVFVCAPLRPCFVSCGPSGKYSCRWLTVVANGASLLNVSLTGGRSVGQMAEGLVYALGTPTYMRVAADSGLLNTRIFAHSGVDFWLECVGLSDALFADLIQLADANEDDGDDSDVEGGIQTCANLKLSAVLADVSPDTGGGSANRLWRVDCRNAADCTQMTVSTLSDTPQAIVRCNGRFSNCSFAHIQQLNRSLLAEHSSADIGALQLACVNGAVCNHWQVFTLLPLASEQSADGLKLVCDNDYADACNGSVVFCEYDSVRLDQSGSVIFPYPHEGGHIEDFGFADDFRYCQLQYDSHLQRWLCVGDACVSGLTLPSTNAPTVESTENTIKSTSQFPSSTLTSDRVLTTSTEAVSSTLYLEESTATRNQSSKPTMAVTTSTTSDAPSGGKKKHTGSGLLVPLLLVLAISCSVFFCATLFWLLRIELLSREKRRKEAQRSQRRQRREQQQLGSEQTTVAGQRPDAAQGPGGQRPVIDECALVATATFNEDSAIQSRSQSANNDTNEETDEIKTEEDESEALRHRHALEIEANESAEMPQSTSVSTGQSAAEALRRADGRQPVAVTRRTKESKLRALLRKLTPSSGSGTTATTSTTETEAHAPAAESQETAAALGVVSEEQFSEMDRRRAEKQQLLAAERDAAVRRRLRHEEEEAEVGQSTMAMALVRSGGGAEVREWQPETHGVRHSQRLVVEPNAHYFGRPLAAGQMHSHLPLPATVPLPLPRLVQLPFGGAQPHFDYWPPHHSLLPHSGGGAPHIYPLSAMHLLPSAGGSLRTSPSPRPRLVRLPPTALWAPPQSHRLQMLPQSHGRVALAPQLPHSGTQQTSLSQGIPQRSPPKADSGIRPKQTHAAKKKRTKEKQSKKRKTGDSHKRAEARAAASPPTRESLRVDSGSEATAQQLLDDEMIL